VDEAREGQTLANEREEDDNEGDEDDQVACGEGTAVVGGEG